MISCRNFCQSVFLQTDKHKLPTVTSEREIRIGGKKLEKRKNQSFGKCFHLFGQFSVAGKQ